MGLWHIRACLKNHSCNLHAPLCGIFHPNSVVVARCDALIRVKSPTNCDAHLAESLFQTCSGRDFYNTYAGEKQLLNAMRTAAEALTEGKKEETYETQHEKSGSSSSCWKHGCSLCRSGSS